MSRRMLLEDDYRENDEIILCENFSPNGQPFYLWQDKMIDWDKYELYINVDIRKFKEDVLWTKLLTISSTDIETFAGNGKLHLYYSKDTLRIQPVNGNNVHQGISIENYNKQKLQITINKNGVYLEEKLVFSTRDHTLMQAVINSLKTSNVKIGNLNNAVCTYNKVSLKKYVERG